jgi:hypothetical protein
VVAVALALGISQATASPACASVIVPGSPAVTGTAALTGTEALSGAAGGSTAAGAQTSGEATHYELASGGTGNCSYPS